MHLSINMDGSAHDSEELPKKRRSRWYYPSHGDDLDLEGDKVIKTLPEENRRRRTIILYKLNNSWGFTIQSYGIHHKKENEIEMLTYVDYIAPGGAAFQAGMRPGDVILSINGQSMEDANHKELVEFIKAAGDTMRMVVLFEDCCKKVELHLRYIKLQRLLMEKIFALRSLEYQEKRVMKGLPQFDSRRSSRSSSSTSLNSSFDDRLSLRPELDRCPSPLVLSGGISPGSSPRGSAVRLTPRHEFERSSMPAGLKYLKKQDSASSLTDVSDSKRKKRPFSLGLEQYLPRPRIPLSPLGGAKNKIPVKKIPSAPSSVSRKPKTTKGRLETLEMNTFKLKLGDGSAVGSSSTDDFDTSPLWQPDASPQLPSKSRVFGYNRMEDEELSESMQSLNSSGSSAVFSLGSPDAGSISDQGNGPFAHSTPKDATPKAPFQPDMNKGSETFYQAFIEGDLDSPKKPNSSSILSPTLNATFNRSDSTSPVTGGHRSLTNRDSGLSEVSSPMSVDSTASRFSYNDLPAITITFVNDMDEDTKL